MQSIDASAPAQRQARKQITELWLPSVPLQARTVVSVPNLKSYYNVATDLPNECGTRLSECGRNDYFFSVFSETFQLYPNADTSQKIEWEFTIAYLPQWHLLLDDCLFSRAVRFRKLSPASWWLRAVGYRKCFKSQTHQGSRMPPPPKVSRWNYEEQHPDRTGSCCVVG